MIWILFLILAFLTVYLSLKLSYLADLMSKTTNINKGFIGGVLVAGITSLPELVTCYSAISLDNAYLAIGDILGSNLFNISIMCLFDILFVKKLFFNKTKDFSLVYVLLFINYIFMFLSFTNILNFSFFNFGFASIIIVITYIIYVKSITTTFHDNSDILNNKMNRASVFCKFFLTALFMVIVSILLTFIVNIIASIYPSFSSSVLGAILLGITTSLPEVLTFVGLLKLNSYNLALADIIGSNLFNILVLAIGDLFTKYHQIYYYVDKEIINIIILCLLTTLINFYQNKRTKSINKFTYLVPSIIIVLFYLFFILL